MTQISFRDIEQLSAYLDEQLTPGERARLESRLTNDPQLASALEDLRQSRALFRRLPQRRAPRNFTLTPKMAGVKAPLPRSYPVFRFASAFAAILLFFTYALNFAAPRVSMLAAAPYGMGGRGGGASDSAPQEQPMAMIAPTEAATVTAEQGLVPGTPTPAGTPTPYDSARNTATSTVIPPSVDNYASKSSEAETAAPAPLISIGWQIGLIALAVLSGGVALILRWRADRVFGKTKTTPKK